MQRSKTPNTIEELTKWLNDKAIYYLSRRDHSRHELSTKLYHALSSLNVISDLPVDQLIEAAIDQMEEYGYIDDYRFARMYCRHKASAFYGAQRIQQGLYQKGVSNEHYQLAVTEETIDFFTFAYDYALKKFSVEQLNDFKLSQKCFRHMVARGYSIDQIKHAFSSIKDEYWQAK